jgi:hypothetical protein
VRILRRLIFYGTHSPEWICTAISQHLAEPKNLGRGLLFGVYLKAGPAMTGVMSDAKGFISKSPRR